VIWFPAQWPETYSYTLSAAMRAGLPIVAPDFGAFPERLSLRPFTWIEPWDRSISHWLDLFLAVRDHLLEALTRQTRYPWSAQGSEQAGGSNFSYRTDYLIPSDRPRDESAAIIDIQWIRRHERRNGIGDGGSMAVSKREKLLTLLLHMRQNAVVAFMLNFIPFDFQQKFKKRLSSRPTYELLLREKNSKNS
jgi:glycosyltransferase involved in cell wall biosynthesis